MPTFAFRAFCPLLAAVLVFGGFGQSLSRAGQINWGSPAFATNQLSGGAEWGGDFVFELGVFDAGFTPTSANVTEWADRWNVADRSEYNATFKLFTGSFSVISNAAPFSAGARGYIWGYRAVAGGGEWILVTDPAWLWPGNSPLDPPVDWGAASASAVVGAVNPGGGVTLRTASVGSAALPSLIYAVWRTQVFSLDEQGDPLVSGLGADPDKDGRTNAMEFALGSNPKIADPPPSFVAAGGPPGARYLQVSAAKPAGRAAFFWAEESDGLAGWIRASENVIVFEDSLTQLTARLPFGGKSRRFLRLSADVF